MDEFQKRLADKMKQMTEAEWNQENSPDKKITAKVTQLSNLNLNNWKSFGTKTKSAGLKIKSTDTNVDGK